MPERPCMKNVQKALLALISMATTACSTLGQGQGGAYRDWALSNPNPAPKSMSPPDYNAEAKSPLIDDTYLSSQADFHFTMGESLSFEGQNPKAIEEFKTTLIYDPKSVHVRMRLATEYVRMGMVTEAIEQSEISVEMEPSNLEARMLLGGLYAGLKMYEPARQQFEEALKIKPDQSEAAIYMGALLAEDRKYEDSIKYFEALTKNPEFKETERAHYYIGRVRAEQGASHYDEAQKAFEKALEVRPEYPEAALALAMLLRAQQRPSQMEVLLKTYQEKFGPEAEMARQLGQYYLENENYEKAIEQLEALDGFERDNLNVKIQIALILIEQKRMEQAAQRLEDVLLLAPESDKVRYYLGAVYEELKRPDLAIMNYKKIPPGSNYFAEAVIHTAHILKMSDRSEAALDVVEQAVKDQDDIPSLYAYWATLLDDQKKYQKAIAMLDDAVERFPSNTQLRFFLGTMHDRMGDSSQTIHHMNKVLEQDQDHVQALNYLAYTYAELGRNLDEAYDLAQRAMSLQPADGYILDTVGWILFKRGDNDGAIKFLEAAYKAKPDEAIIAEHLGDAYLRHQMWQKAQKMYQRAASLESDRDKNKKIQEKLANLEDQKQPATRAPASQ